MNGCADAPNAKDLQRRLRARPIRKLLHELNGEPTESASQGGSAPPWDRIKERARVVAQGAEAHPQGEQGPRHRLRARPGRDIDLWGTGQHQLSSKSDSPAGGPSSATTTRARTFGGGGGLLGPPVDVRELEEIRRRASSTVSSSTRSGIHDPGKHGVKADLPCVASSTSWGCSSGAWSTAAATTASERSATR